MASFAVSIEQVTCICDAEEADGRVAIILTFGPYPDETERTLSDTWLAHQFRHRIPDARIRFGRRDGEDHR